MKGSLTTAAGKVRWAAKYLRYVSPFYMGRRACDTVLQRTVGWSLDELRENSFWLAAAYYPARRILRVIRRDGVGALTNLSTLQSIAIMGVFAVGIVWYKRANRRHERAQQRHDLDLEGARALGKAPENAVTTPVPPAPSEQIPYADRVGAAVSAASARAKTTGRATSTAVKRQVAALTAAARPYVRSATTTIGRRWRACKAAAAPYIARGDVHLTRFEVFVLGLHPRPSEVPKPLREEWGLPDPSESDEKFRVERRGDGSVVATVPQE